MANGACTTRELSQKARTQSLLAASLSMIIVAVRLLSLMLRDTNVMLHRDGTTIPYFNKSTNE